MNPNRALPTGNAEEVWCSLLQLSSRWGGSGLLRWTPLCEWLVARVASPTLLWCPLVGHVVIHWSQDLDSSRHVAKPFGKVCLLCVLSHETLLESKSRAAPEGGDTKISCTCSSES